MTVPPFEKLEAEHFADAVEHRHRFPPVTFRGEVWDLTHLDAFAFRCDPGLGFHIDVVVLFSCHCFSHDIAKDERGAANVPPDELYEDDHEVRVLNEERYVLSRTLLMDIMGNLSGRHIQIAPDVRGRQNFFTLEVVDPDGQSRRYAVFLEPKKDARRKRRILLRVQSAYILDRLPNRLQKAGKVTLSKLLRATYLGNSF